MAKNTRNELIADLLMGAAFADRRLSGAEYEAVKNALARAMEVEEIPPVLAARLEWFQPDEFDPRATAAKLRLETDRDKRILLELIVSVHEADDIYDLDEDAYLRLVAEALGLAPEEYEDLMIEDLQLESRESLMLLQSPLPSKPPPPLPSKPPPPLPKKR